MKRKDKLLWSCDCIIIEDSFEWPNAVQYNILWQIVLWKCYYKKKWFGFERGTT